MTLFSQLCACCDHKTANQMNISFINEQMCISVFQTKTNSFKKSFFSILTASVLTLVILYSIPIFIMYLLLLFFTIGIVMLGKQ